jgi:multidrug efflux system membrane fusion protein
MRKLVIVAMVPLAVALVGGGRFAIGERASSAPLPAAPPAVPVQSAVAVQADVPNYLLGLGTTQALNTVTVRVRVDGELQKVAFREGQTVQAGELLAQIDPRPFQAQLDQAIAKAAQDEAQLGNARRDLQRFSELAKKQFATLQQLDTQKALVAQDEAMLKGDRAAIENARVQLGYTSVISPISGRVGIRLVDAGNIVHAADSGGLVVITQLQPISVIFTLPEESLAEVNRAMRDGPLTVLALSHDGGRRLGEGSLQLVDNQIDQTTGTIKLKAQFPNADLMLWPGQFLNIRLLLRTEHNAVTMPAGAVQRGAGGEFAWVIRPDSTVAVQPLELGQIGDGIAVVHKGLSAGARVVTAGQYRLQPGAKVEIRAAAGQPGSAPKARS